MAYAHTSVNEMSAKFKQNEKRYNYTTPKSFLEQIMLYKNLLEKKMEKMSQHKEHLVNGIQKLKTTASQVIQISICIQGWGTCDPPDAGLQHY